jgi:hypothetical protein
VALLRHAPVEPLEKPRAKTVTKSQDGRILIVGSSAMLASSVDWKSKRETIRAKRDLLFKHYLKNPHDSRMALEIKDLDDEIAECTEHMDLNKAKHR